MKRCTVSIQRESKNEIDEEACGCRVVASGVGKRCSSARWEVEKKGNVKESGSDGRKDSD